ncbi:protein of unknown function [Cyclobacterium lianum]|uniref:PA14 domain-containing protein n=2 Tax=Cyclobacterium lianum TaxID=388280 RepID=A0A1M7MQT4_9BACT|nr:protein of unknown function [Cyclobacterium lianum]
MFRSICGVIPASILLFSLHGLAQTTLSFENLDAFQDPGKTWKLAGAVMADINETGDLTVSKGTGILVNLPTEKDKGEDLYTKASFGDMDLELDFLMARGSNSGVYLQGMYEIQLLDSWGTAIPSAGDNGGIYERWDESQPEGMQGYQGYAPRQNASKAPGLWQNLKVSFRAPRFDANGKKIENARIISAVLNGVTIHENIALFGPTRGAMAEKEMSSGPVRIQGDHGAVAFRNIKITPYDNPAPVLDDITFDLYQGRYEAVPDFSQLTPARTGQMERLGANIRGAEEQFLIRYRGELEIKHEGQYIFNLSAPGGAGSLAVGTEQVIAAAAGNLSGEIQLTAGTYPVEILYAKVQDWIPAGIGLEVSGPGIRTVQLSDLSFSRASGPDPILVDPKERPVLRSFMDIPGGSRITHAVSVGSPYKVHYTYDMDFGDLVQVWRGDFLNATPMWNSRGDGSSRPMGSVTYTQQAALSFARLQDLQQPWPSDTLGSHFKVKGYKVLSDDHHLQFEYESYGVSVSDELEFLTEGEGVKRVIKTSSAGENTYLRLARNASIQNLGEGLFLIGDKAYYLRLDDSIQDLADLRSIDGSMELLIPALDNITYFLLF